jgi:hypothetical protein
MILGPSEMCVQCLCSRTTHRREKTSVGRTRSHGLSLVSRLTNESIIFDAVIYTAPVVVDGSFLFSKMGLRISVRFVFSSTGFRTSRAS